MAQYVRVTGAKELEKALLALNAKVATSIGRKALRQAANPVLSRAREAVPVNEGRLRRSLRVRVDRLLGAGTGAGVVLSAMVSVSGRLGTRPRKSDRQSTVKGVKGPARYNYQIGSSPSVYGRFVEFGIPGKPAHPFLRPAWDSEGGEVALRRIGKELGEGIERAAAGTGRK